MSKCYICFKIFKHSITSENETNFDYKYALLIGTFSLFSSIFITYSSVINLKYINNHFGERGTVDCLGRLGMICNYLMLTSFGIFMTVVPMQVLDMARTVVAFFVTCFSCCSKSAL